MFFPCQIQPFILSTSCFHRSTIMNNTCSFLLEPCSLSKWKKILLTKLNISLYNCKKTNANCAGSRCTSSNHLDFCTNLLKTSDKTQQRHINVLKQYTRLSGKSSVCQKGSVTTKCHKTLLILFWSSHGGTLDKVLETSAEFSSTFKVRDIVSRINDSHSWSF